MPVIIGIAIFLAFIGLMWVIGGFIIDNIGVSNWLIIAAIGIVICVVALIRDIQQEKEAFYAKLNAQKQREKDAVEAQKRQEQERIAAGEAARAEQREAAAREKIEEHLDELRGLADLVKPDGKNSQIFTAMNLSLTELSKDDDITSEHLGAGDVRPEIESIVGELESKGLGNAAVVNRLRRMLPKDSTEAVA